MANNDTCNGAYWLSPQPAPAGIFPPPCDTPEPVEEECVPVSIIIQPKDTEIFETVDEYGACAEFTVGVTVPIAYSSYDIKFQWYKNGVFIPGATEQIYKFIAYLEDGNADYYVIVGSGECAVQSDTARLNLELCYACDSYVDSILAIDPEHYWRLNDRPSAGGAGTPDGGTYLAETGGVNLQTNGVGGGYGSLVPDTCGDTATYLASGAFGSYYMWPAGPVLLGSASVGAHCFIKMSRWDFHTLFNVEYESTSGNTGKFYCTVGKWNDGISSIRINLRYTNTSGSNVSNNVHIDINIGNFSLIVQANDTRFEIYANFELVHSGDVINLRPYVGPGDGLQTVIHNPHGQQHQHLVFQEKWFTPEDIATLSAGLDRNSESYPCCDPMFITSAPTNVRVDEGEIARFSVAASDEVCTYNWYRDDVLIPDETSSNYSFVTTAEDDGTFYKAIAYSQCNGVESAAAKLTIGGEAPSLQTIYATNIYTSASNHVGGSAPITNALGIDHTTGNIMSTAIGSGTIIFSDDDGATWTEKATPNSATTNTILHDDAKGTWYITNGSYSSRWMRIYYSTDDGNSWTIMDSSPAVSTYNWSIALASNGNIIHPGRGSNNTPAITIYTNPPTAERVNFTKNNGGIVGNGFHAMETGGYYFGNQNHNGIDRVNPALTIEEESSGNNTSGSGWATDGQGTILMPTLLTETDSAAPFDVSFTRLSTTSVKPHPVEIKEFPYRIDAAAAAYGNGVWLMAGSGYDTANKKKVHIFMSASGAEGTFVHEIDLELSIERGASAHPTVYGIVVNIEYYKDDTWIIEYISSPSATPASKHIIDTFEFIPTT